MKETTDGPVNQDQRLEHDRTPRPTLDAKIEAVVDDWFSALTQTIDPMISAAAAHALSESRDNLKRQLGQALAFNAE